MIAQQRQQRRACQLLAAAVLVALANHCAFIQWGPVQHKTTAEQHGMLRHASRGVTPTNGRRCFCLVGSPKNKAVVGRIVRTAVGLFFATTTGNTETVAGMIADATGLEATDISEVSPADLESFDGLMVGVPTWNTGADEYRSGTTWDDYLDEIKGVDLQGKPVAVFGCGDSVAYGDNFCDGIEELHEAFASAGAKTLGYVDASGYQHAESKSVREGKFLGLPLDQDNEEDLSEGRVRAWVEQLKSEGMPL